MFAIELSVLVSLNNINFKLSTINTMLFIQNVVLISMLKVQARCAGHTSMLPD